MEITPEIVRDLLHYDPETGIFTWRERGKHWFKPSKKCNPWKTWNTRFAGKRAGTVHTNQSGYQCRFINLFGKHYKEHRIAWLWMTDDPLPSHLDHPSRDATDNRWKNIRASDRVRNMHNMSLSRRNTSGVSGVCWFKPTGKWAARCMVNGKCHSLGYFDDLEEAARVVREFRAENGFNPDHGAELAHYHQ